MPSLLCVSVGSMACIGISYLPFSYSNLSFHHPGWASHRQAHLASHVYSTEWQRVIPACCALYNLRSPRHDPRLRAWLAQPLFFFSFCRSRVPHSFAPIANLVFRFCERRRPCYPVAENFGPLYLYVVHVSRCATSSLLPCRGLRTRSYP